MAKRDYYEILGINRDADATAIKRAYRGLAMQYHPDRNPGDEEAAEKMKEINEAYAVLSNGHKRRLYDTYGHAGLEGYTQEDIFRGVDFSSLFREFGLGDMFGFGGGLFDSIFGRGTTYRRGPRKGTDLRYDLSMTLEEAASGIEKTVELPRVETCTACSGSGAEPEGLVNCETCGGTGQIVREQRSGSSLFRQITSCGNCQGRGKIIKEPCKACEGKGVIEKAEELQVTIPPGVDTGYRVRIEGGGEKGEDLPGDLYIVVNVKRHPVFERHGDDIYIQNEISFTTAALGGEIEVPGLSGSHSLEIPEGTQTGTVFRIEGEGVPRPDGYGRGDQYVIVKVLIPTNLTDREKDILRQFDELRQGAEGGADRADNEH